MAEHRLLICGKPTLRVYAKAYQGTKFGDECQAELDRKVYKGGLLKYIPKNLLKFDGKLKP